MESAPKASGLSYGFVVSDLQFRQDCPHFASGLLWFHVALIKPTFPRSGLIRKISPCCSPLTYLFLDIGSVLACDKAVPTRFLIFASSYKQSDFSFLGD